MVSDMDLINYSRELLIVTGMFGMALALASTTASAEEPYQIPSEEEFFFPELQFVSSPSNSLL